MSHRENVTTAAHFKQWCKRSFSFLNSFIYIFFIAFCRYEIIAQFREQCSDNCVLELECGCSIHRPSSSIKFICVFVCAYRTHSANKNEQQQINKQTKNGDNRTASIPSFSGASIKLWRVSVAASEKETENKGNFIYDFVWCRKFSFYVRIMSNKKVCVQSVALHGVAAEMWCDPATHAQMAFQWKSIDACLEVDFIARLFHPATSQNQINIYYLQSFKCFALFHVIIIMGSGSGSGD